MAIPNWTEGVQAQRKRKGEYQRPIFTTATLFKIKTNLFQLTSCLLLNPTLHSIWLPAPLTSDLALFIFGHQQQLPQKQK